MAPNAGAISLWLQKPMDQGRPAACWAGVILHPSFVSAYLAFALGASGDRAGAMALCRSVANGLSRHAIRAWDHHQDRGTPFQASSLPEHCESLHVPASTSMTFLAWNRRVHPQQQAGKPHQDGATSTARALPEPHPSSVNWQRRSTASSSAVFWLLSSSSQGHSVRSSLLPTSLAMEQLTQARPRAHLGRSFSLPPNSRPVLRE